jgi:hypothetical protein
MRRRRPLGNPPPLCHAGAPASPRHSYPWARPWNLAYRGQPSGAIVELTSYPYEGDPGEPPDPNGPVYIMARSTIGDATTNTRLTLTDLGPLPWPQEKIDGYREGFMHGWHCCLDAVQQVRLERKPEVNNLGPEPGAKR